MRERARGNAYDVIVVGGGHNGLVAAGLPRPAGAAHRRAGAAPRRRRGRGQRAPVRAGLHRHVAVVRRLAAPARAGARPAAGPARLPRLPAGPLLRARAATGGTCSCRPTTRARREQIEKFSSKDADAIDALGRASWTASARVLGPMLDDIPPKVGSRRPADLARQAMLLRRLRGVDARKAVDITRLLTVQRRRPGRGPLRVRRDARRARRSPASSAPGPARARPGTAYVMLHHHLGDIGDGQTGAWGFPRGGMGAVTRALAAAARSFGARDPHRGAGRPHHHAAAARVTGVVAGVRRGAHGADGRHHRAPADLVPAPAGPPRPARRLRRRHRDLEVAAAAR